MPWRSLSLLVAAAMVPSSALAADEDRGRLLYENHCTTCHTSQVHIRENARVKDADSLRYWITRWSRTLELRWAAEDVDDVQHYLTRAFYPFESPQ